LVRARVASGDPRPLFVLFVGMNPTAPFAGTTPDPAARIGKPRPEPAALVAALRGAAATAHVPVAVLAPADADAVARFYAAGGNCWVARPESGEALDAALRALAEFWLGLVSLPETPPDRT